MGVEDYDAGVRDRKIGWMMESLLRSSIWVLFATLGAGAGALTSDADFAHFDVEHPPYGFWNRVGWSGAGGVGLYIVLKLLARWFTLHAHHRASQNFTEEVWRAKQNQ